MDDVESQPIPMGEFALLKVVSINSIGAFLDWGQPKDLFLPFAEQTHDLRTGDLIIVYPYVDKSGRISCSMRLERNKTSHEMNYSVGQKVDLIIVNRTDLGFKAIINRKHWGVLYENEIFQDLTYGQEIPGYITKIRDDNSGYNKIDLNLQKIGHHAGEDIAPKILELLKEEGGFLAINDKTEAETIYKMFGVSKKKYKIALGGLYKKRIITVDKDGIRLV
jgi:uncharacterized protein